MSYQMNRSIIRAYLNDDEIPAQMAEEASELAQACLKLRRAIGDNNPTPRVRTAGHQEPCGGMG